MKKYLKVLFVGILLISLLVACGKPETGGKTPAPNEPNNTGNEPKTEEPNEAEIVPEEGASLILWDNGEAEEQWARYVADEFEKKYGIPVEYQNVGHTDSANKLETDGPAGLGADVFNAAHDHLGNLVAAGLVIENMVADEYYGNYVDAAIDAVSFTENGERKLYGYPIAIETYALYYNKDLVDKPAETWEELFEQAKAFQADSTRDNRKFGFMMEVANFYYTSSFIAGYGGYVFGDGNTDPSDIGLNNDGSVKAAQFMQKINNELLPLKREDITYELIQEFFNGNNMLYTINGPWAIAGHRDAGVNFGVTTLPKLENGEVPKSFSGIKAYYVNSYSKYPRAATLLAQFASSEEMLQKRFEMTGQIPPHSGLLESDIIQSDEYVAAFSEQLEFAIPMPNLTQMPSVWGPMESAFVTIWNDGVDPQGALDAAVQQIKEATRQ